MAEVKGVRSLQFPGGAVYEEHTMDDGSVVVVKDTRDDAAKLEAPVP